MAFKYHGDLVFSTGEYKDKDGNDKKSWTKAGAVPVGEWSGWMKIFTKDKDGNDKKSWTKAGAVPVGEWSGWMKISTKDKPNTPRPAKDAAIDDIDDNPISLSDVPF